MAKLRDILTFILMIISLIGFLIFYSIMSLRIAFDENRKIYLFNWQGNLYYQTVDTNYEAGNKKLVPRGKARAKDEIDQIDLAYEVYVPDSKKNYVLNVKIKVIVEEGVKNLSDYIVIKQLIKDSNGKLVENSNYYSIFNKNMTDFWYKKRYNLYYRITLKEPSNVDEANGIANSKFRIEVEFSTSEV